MRTSKRSARGESGSSHQSTVSHETTAKKHRDTVYTFSFTTDWFHTVNVVALMIAASAPPTRGIHADVERPVSTRSATRNQTPAVVALITAERRLTRCAIDGAIGRSVNTRPINTK